MSAHPSIPPRAFRASVRPRIPGRDNGEVVLRMRGRLTIRRIAEATP